MTKLLWIMFLLSTPLLVSCNSKWLSWYPEDNLIEEAVEEVILDETGWDMDLTPFSPE